MKDHMLTKKDVQTVEEIVEDKISRHLGVFIEQMNDQFQRIIEIIEVIDKRTREIPIVLRRLERAEARLDANEADIRYHDGRLKRLETDQA